MRIYYEDGEIVTKAPCILDTAILLAKRNTGNIARVELSDGDFDLLVNTAFAKGVGDTLVGNMHICTQVEDRHGDYIVLGRVCFQRNPNLGDCWDIQEQDK